MKIIIDNRITDKFCKGLDRLGTVIAEITIHATAGGGDTIGWMASGGYMGNGKYRSEDYKKGVGLFHYHISKGGKVSQIIDPKYFVYHSSSGAHDKSTIGIELEKENRTNSDTPTDEQYDSLNDLIAFLIDTYPTINTLSSHDYNAKYYSNRDPKPCPGSFDWSRIANKALKQNV
jgi:N-acetyl-anhydromuramyl-L-alanine amidase AmpD